jgi:hypothetical protein
LLVVCQDADDTTRIDGKKIKKNVFKSQQMLFSPRPLQPNIEGIDFSAKHRKRAEPRESNCFSDGSYARGIQGMKQFNLNSSPSLRHILDQKLTAHYASPDR